MVVALVVGVTYVLTSSLFEAMGNVSQLPPADRGMIAGFDLWLGGRISDYEDAAVKSPGSRDIARNRKSKNL